MQRMESKTPSNQPTTASKSEYYPRGLVITKNKGTLVAEWRRKSCQEKYNP